MTVIMTRSSKFLLVLLFVAAFSSNLLHAVEAKPIIGSAQWVWTDAEAIRSGGGEAFFRYTLRLDRPVASARVAITADNGYQLLVNNRQVAEKLGYGAEFWNTINLLDIQPFLVPNASNVIAIKATCLGGSAGLIAAFQIVLDDGTVIDIPTGEAWRATDDPAERWWESDHNDAQWNPAAAMGKLGVKPWGMLAIPSTLTDPATLLVQQTGGGVRQNDSFVSPDSLTDDAFPSGIVFLEGRAPDCSTPLATTNFRIRETRAYWENDVPAPSISGHRLYSLVPARPDGKKTLLLDAGTGCIGSPIVSFDGTTIYFCMAKSSVEPAAAGERLTHAALADAFYHLYQVDADGTNLKQLTGGLWHDTDPCPMPDGSIVFSSTRTGARDEYHANTAHALHRLNPDGTIETVTMHVTADADPELMADGRLAFVRHDNFLERAKVETHIHCVRPDGTAGEVLIGPDRQAVRYDRQTAAEHDALWLRSYGFGSPAPLPDGRVAALSHSGPVITTLAEVDSTDNIDEQIITQQLDDAASPGRASAREKKTAYDVVPMPCRVSVLDMSPLPDNRLLVTTLRRSLAAVDPQTGQAVLLYKSPKEPIHSVCYLGERTIPREWVATMDTDEAALPNRSGFLYAANVFNSKQTEADWERVKAVRVWRGEPMTLRAALHQYGHVGSVGIELGTVPLMPDGSFYAEVPADVPLAMQAVDAEGRAVVNELSWVYVRPGEFRSCIGCHADKSATSGRGTGAVAPSIHGSAVDLTLAQRPPRFRANNGANGGVLNLQLDRMRETISVDLYSDYGDPAHELKRLATELASPDASVRFSAVQRVALFRPAVSLVLRDPHHPARQLQQIVTSDDNSSVRVQAAIALATSATPDAIPALVTALNDDNSSVVQAAHITLDHITGRSLIAADYKLDDMPSGGVAPKSADDWKAWLAEHTTDNIVRLHTAHITACATTPYQAPLSREANLTLRFALESLAHLSHGTNSRETCEAICTVFAKSLDLRTRLVAIQTLGDLGDVAAIPLLQSIIIDAAKRKMPPHKHNPEFGWAAMNDHLGGAAIAALVAIAQQSGDARQQILATLQDAIEALGEFWFYTYRTADHSWLMGSVSGVVQFRLIEGLLLLGVTPQEIRPQLATKLVQQLPIDSDRGILLESDAYETVLSRLLWQLELAPQILDVALDVLEQRESNTALRDVRDAVVASPPAISTGELDPASRAAQWVAVLANVHEPLCKDDARFASRIRAVFEQYRSYEPSRTRSWVCFMLARAIGRLEDAAATPHLIAALVDEPTEFDFGCYAPPHVFLNRAMTPVHRAAAAEALGRIGDPAAVPVLIATVSEMKNMMDVRAAAAIGLQHMSARNRLSDATLAIIRQLAATYPEIYTQHILEQMGKTE